MDESLANHLWTLVYKWFARFKRGNFDPEDLKCKSFELLQCLGASQFNRKKFNGPAILCSNTTKITFFLKRTIAGNKNGLFLTMWSEKEN